MTTPAKPMPTPLEFERQLLRFINGTILGGAANVDRDTRLFEDGYMNSLRILDLIAAVEKTLGKRVPDRAVRLANFRTVGTIVSAFHADAETTAPDVPATRDVVFERRGERSRFASPIDPLVKRGDLRLPSAGQVTLSGLALGVFHAIDRTVARWARELGAAEHRYPSLIDRAVLERAGRVDHLTLVTPSERQETVIPSERHETVIPSERSESRNRDRPDQEPASARPTALAPAVCYHAYPELEGMTLGPDAEVLTAVGRCYRHEDGQYVPLERLWDFTMREIIILGTRDQVEAQRQSLVRQVGELITLLELDGSVEPATDPFFAAGDEGRRLMQQAGALKHELRLAVDATGRTIAAASFNHHHDYFGTRFAIKLTSGVPAHSGCVAFGLERWVLAVLAQHGVNEHDWPAPARAWLADASSGARA
jgi:acyl carrier protein